MNILVKDFPKKRDLKKFYNLNTSKNYIVKSVDYSKHRIILNCVVRDKKRTVFPSFYQIMNFANFDNGTFILVIESKYFDHLLYNFELNYEYITNLK